MLEYVNMYSTNYSVASIITYRGKNLISKIIQDISVRLINTQFYMTLFINIIKS